MFLPTASLLTGGSKLLHSVPPYLELVKVYRLLDNLYTVIVLRLLTPVSIIDTTTQ